MRDYRKSVQKKDDEKRSGARDYRTSLVTIEKKEEERQKEKKQQKEEARPATVQFPTALHPDNAIRVFNQQNQNLAPVAPVKTQPAWKAIGKDVLDRAADTGVALLENIGRPISAVRGVLDEATDNKRSSIGSVAGRVGGALSGKEQTPFNEIFNNLGFTEMASDPTKQSMGQYIQSQINNKGRSVANLAADVLADPLTYVGGIGIARAGRMAEEAAALPRTNVVSEMGPYPIQGPKPLQGPPEAPMQGPLPPSTAPIRQSNTPITPDLKNQVEDYVRQNPNATINELQGKFKLGYSRLQSIKDNVAAAPDRTPPVTGEPIVLTPENPTATIGSQRPVSPQNATTPPASPIGERGGYRNLRDNANLSDEFNANLERSDKNYEIARDKTAVEQANKNVDDLASAEAKYLGNRTPEKEDIVTAQRILQKLDALGEHERSLNVANKLMKDLTRGGQTSQAASIIGKLSPEGQLLNLTRAAARNGKEVSVADKVKFQSLAAEVQTNSGAGIRENQFNQILDRVQRGENVSPEEMKTLSDFLARAKKVIKPKEKPVVDELPPEFKDVKKRDKIVSFLDKAEKDALARIAARKNRLNALPIDEWKDHAIVVASQIGKGSIKAATHVEDLVKLFGEEIRPVAGEVFKRAQSLVKVATRSTAAGKLESAEAAFRRMSGEAQKEKAIVEETANHVRKLIEDAKAGKLDQADIQKLRDYSDEIAELAKPSKAPTQEQKFLQSVKALAKKIAQVENEKIPADQANREVSSLLRQVTKLTEEAKPLEPKLPIDNKALSDIAHDVLKKTRPNPKPTTLQEKLVEKYIRDNPVRPDDITKLRQLAKDVSELSGDNAMNADMAMQKILNSYEKSSAWDKVQAIRYIAMLLNSSTQAINAVSGPIMATTGYVADVLGTMIDIPLSTVLKKPRTTTLYGTNPLRFIARYMKGLKVGGKAGAQGVNPSGIAGPNDIRGLTYKSLYNPLGLAERALGAVAKGADYATYNSVQKSEMLKQAFLDAKNKGIKGKAARDSHIREFLNDPPEEAILQADRIGKNTTFQRSDSLGGSLANYLSNPQGKAKILKPVTGTIFPFVRTPVNIASTAVTMTPVGIIKGLYQLIGKSDASRREAIRSLSLGLTGSGISALGYYLSQLGIITGSNDSGDKDVDAIREQTGGGKYRFNTSALSRYLVSMMNLDGSEAAEKAAKYQKGDKQFDYNKLQPLAFPLAIGAGIEKNKDKGALGVAQGAGVDAYGSLYGMSTLKGVQDIFQPSYGGTVGEKALGAPTRIIESFLKSFSPSMLAQEARRQDPVMRKTAYNNGIGSDVRDYYMSRTPGLSQKLPASKTTLGQNKLNSPGITGQYLNPYRSDVAPFNEAAVIISRLIDSTGDLTLAPSAPDKKVTGKDKGGNQVTLAIPPDRYAKLQEDIGKEVTAKILRVNKSLSDAKQAAAVTKIYEDVNKKYRDQVKRELGIRVTR